MSISLSYDDQVKCVKIWKFFSEKDTRPEQWNEKAADRLATMVAEVNKCSASMDLVPRPAGSKPGWFWLLNQAFGALRRYITSDRSLIYDVCKREALRSHRTSVEMALQGLE